MTSYAWIGASLGAFIATRVSEDATGRAALRARLLQTVPALEPVYGIMPECALDILEVMGCALLGSVCITLVFTALSGVLPAVAVAAAYACIRSGHADRLREMGRELLAPVARLGHDFTGALRTGPDFTGALRTGVAPPGAVPDAAPRTHAS